MGVLLWCSKHGSCWSFAKQSNFLPTTRSRASANTEAAKRLPAPATVADDGKSPALFCGGKKGMRCIAQQTRKKPRHGVVLWNHARRRKKGESRGFDQRERVAFSGHSFLKRVTAGVGAHSPHPAPRISIRGPRGPLLLKRSHSA